jgi:hypothetical protein
MNQEMRKYIISANGNSQNLNVNNEMTPELRLADPPVLGVVSNILAKIDIGE